MVAAGIILVLAWFPYIEITSFKPLGFDIKKGGELSVWSILAIVLVYYALRFCADCWMDYTGWIDTYRGNVATEPGTDVGDNKHNRHVRRLNRKFWILDVAPPALMFLAALFATYQQVDPLV